MKTVKNRVRDRLHCSSEWKTEKNDSNIFLCSWWTANDSLISDLWTSQNNHMCWDFNWFILNFFSSLFHSHSVDGHSTRNAIANWRKQSQIRISLAMGRRLRVCVCSTLSNHSMQSKRKIANSCKWKGERNILFFVEWTTIFVFFFSYILFSLRQKEREKITT